MKNNIKQTITVLAAIALAGPASAVTIFDNWEGGGDSSLVDAFNWLNGLPTDGNDGTIALDSTSSDQIFGTFGTATLQFTAGTFTQTNSGGKTNLKSGTWSVEGGHISSPVFFLLNGSAVTVNVSAGSVAVLYTGSDVGFGHFGGKGQVNISGTGMIETWRVDASHNTDFAPGWIGSWTVTDNFSTAADWESIIIDGSSTDSYNWTYDGAGITNQAEFDAVFNVSADGMTLSLVPEPSSAALLGLAGLGLILRRRK